MCERLYVYARVCVKCGQVCGGVLIYFVMFCDVCADRPEGFAPYAVLMCLFLLYAFTEVI